MIAKWLMCQCITTVQSQDYGFKIHRCFGYLPFHGSVASCANSVTSFMYTEPYNMRSNTFHMLPILC